MDDEILSVKELLFETVEIAKPIGNIDRYPGNSL